MSEGLTILPDNVTNHVNKKAARAVGLALAVAISSVSCAPQTKVQLGEDVDMGTLPADICMINGRPDILTVSTQSDGDVFISYVDTKGEVIAQVYTNQLNTNIGGFKVGGRYIWKGASCPSK